MGRCPGLERRPGPSRRLGIGMVFQHFSLFETLTVAQNIALGMTGRPDIASLSAQIASVSERYGLPIDPVRRIHNMSAGERQRVEIVRALLINPRLLIMDEPTSVLTPQAVEGCSIRCADFPPRAAASSTSLTSSRRSGPLPLGDRTASGRVTGICDPRQESAESMARMMVGAKSAGANLRRPGSARRRCSRSSN